MEIGEMLVLGKGPYPVVACEHCGAKMVDVAQADLGMGDLLRMKVHGLKMGDPSTKRVWCIDCEVDTPSTRRKIKEYFDSPEPSSDSHFWGYSGGSSSGGSSSDSSSGGDSSGGFSFGGFGGGGFSGGGASGGF